MTLGHIALIVIALAIVLAILMGIDRLVGRFSRGVREGIAGSRDSRETDT